jgi:hypothetical protein
MSIEFTFAVTYHSVDPPFGLMKPAFPPSLPALLTQSAVGMESRFFATIKWLPSGFPGSVAWLALPRQEDDMESQFATMKWLPSGFPG